MVVGAIDETEIVAVPLTPLGGVNVAVYVVPVPVKLVREPNPVRVISVNRKTEGVESVKVIVAVCPAVNEFKLEVIAMVKLVTTGG